MSGYGQEIEIRQLSAFDKIIVSPLIDLILIPGETESVRLEVINTEIDKVNSKVNGHTLRIFLDDARIVAKRKRRIKRRKRHDDPSVLFERSIYRDVTVKAYVTYKSLRNLQVRGDARITSQGKLETDKFKLKLFGDNRANFEYLKTNCLKVVLYGDNIVKIEGGKATKQVYKSYGDNRFDALNMPGEYVRSHLYGENELTLNIDERIRISSMGVADIFVKGRPKLRKGIVFGDIDIRRIR